MVKQLHYEYTLGMTLIIKMSILSLSFLLGQWWMYFLSFFFFIKATCTQKAKTFRDQTNNGSKKKQNKGNNPTGF